MRSKILMSVVGGLAAAALVPVASATAADRVVVLNGDIAEIVYAVGAGPSVVAVDTSATYPTAAAKARKIGYQRSLAAEPILALDPDLILGTPDAGPPSVLDQLRQAGRKVVILPATKTVNGIPEKIRRVGRALGGAFPAKARSLAASTAKRITAVRRTLRRGGSKPRVAFLYVRGSQVQMIGGKGSGADSMIEAAGGLDVGAASGLRGFRPLTPEGLVRLRPDVIVTLSAGLQSVGGASGLLKVPGIAQTPAGRARRILAFDDQQFLGLGPRAPQAIAALARGLRTK